MSAVQFLEHLDPRGSSELAQLVVVDAERAAEKVTFTDVLDTGALVRRALRGALVLGCGLALVVGFPRAARTWFERCVLLSATAEWPKNTNLIVTAQYGQVVTELHQGLRVAVPRGSDLAIIVSATGEVPTRATLSFEFGVSHIRGSRPLARLGDNRFRHVFEKVVEDCDFFVRGGDDEVGPIHIAVVRPPWLDSLAITAEPPAYTKVPRRTFGTEAGEIALPAGTTVTIAAHCTKTAIGASLDVHWAGTSLDAPAERHAFVSNELLARGLAEARDLEDKDRYAEAARSYETVVESARARMAASDARVAPLASCVAELRALEGEKETAALAAKVRAYAKDPRITGALQPSVAATESLTFSFVLDRTAACTIDVRDTDDLTLDRAVALTLRAIPDAPPKIQLATNGIGQLVTPECTIPIAIKASDDYGLYSGFLRYKTSGATQAQKGEGELRIPGVGDLRRELDLPFEWNVGTLHPTPGTFLSFYCEVQDDDPKGRKSSPSTGVALRVVAPEELLMDLIRRQHELRRELERVRDDEAKLAEGLDTLDQEAQKRAGKKHREVGKTVADAARAMTQVVDEMRNNRLLDERARTRLQEDVVTPLETLRDGELVHARDLADAVLALEGGDRDAKSKDAGASTHEVVAQLDAVIAHMKRVTDLAELVARLRDFLKKQRDLMEETRKMGGDR